MTETTRKMIIGVAMLLVGIFSILPVFSVYTKMGDNFQRIWPERDGDRLYYFARIHEVGDGHAEINHPYFAEHKDETYPQATLAEKGQALLGQVLFMQVSDTQVILDFIAPIIIAFLTYLLLIALGVRWGYALLATALLATVISGGFLKPIHPQITFPLLLLFLLCWAKLISSPRKPLYALLAGISLGLLFLTYFYHWSFVIVIIGIYVIVLLKQKNYELLKYHLLIVLIGFLIGLPYFLLIKAGVGAPYHAETAVRVGVYYSHFPETIPRLLIGLAWICFFLWWGYVSKLNTKKEFIIITVLLLANVIYSNHQILSGVIIQNANHWSFMPVFIFTLSSAYAISETIKLRKIGTTAFVYAVVVIISIAFLVPTLRLMSFSFSAQRYVSSHYPTSLDISRQNYRPLFDWIDTQAKDSVVLGNQDLMKFIPAYTHANVYYSDYAFNLPGSDKEVVERALLSRFFDKDFLQDPTFGMQVDTRILWTQPAQTERTTHFLHRLLNIPYTEKYSLEREVTKVQDIHRSLEEEGWNLSLLNRYKLDFIVWDTKNNPEWKLDNYEELTLVESVGNFKIYKLQSGI